MRREWDLKTDDVHDTGAAVHVWWWHKRGTVVPTFEIAFGRITFGHAARIPSARVIIFFADRRLHG